ncbi:MAG: hypothetical protein U5K79_02095 [Cyclobacteriaceae bacterium]|nr:hypothetical protein [Cyclobacteriaceae bacterium]
MSQRARMMKPGLLYKLSSAAGATTWDKLNFVSLMLALVFRNLGFATYSYQILYRTKPESCQKINHSRHFSHWIFLYSYLIYGARGNDQRCIGYGKQQ